MGRQEVMLTLKPEDLPVCVSQTLREMEEVYFCAHFCDLIVLFRDDEVFLCKNINESDGARCQKY